MIPTPVLLVGTIVAWCIVEAWRITHHEATISTDITTFQKLWPTFGFLVALTTGLLFGHWFWAQ